MTGFLALDQGTTSTKAYRCGDDGRPVPVGTRTHRQIRPHPGWVEHDPMELLADLRALIDAAGRCRAVGLANQGETVVAWDGRTKEPLANAIVWQDERTHDAIERMRADGLETLTRTRAGLPLDAYFSASKLRWLLDHAPEAPALLRQGRLRLGTSDAFFLDALTGVFATDVSTASRTSLMHLHRLEWDTELCRGFGVPIETLPEIRPTVGDFGTLPGGAALVVGVVDQQAALFGHDCRGPGDLKITFGTGAFALGLTGEAPVMADGLLPTVAWKIGAAPAAYALDGGVLTAGAALDWLRGVGLLDDFAALEVGGDAASRGLVFVPAQAGLGSPHWDRSARGAWIGLDLDTTRAELARAVLEGIALRAAEVVQAFAAARGGAVGRVSIDGGISRSEAFARFLAGAIGQPVAVAAAADLTALGVLRLSGAALDARALGWRTVAPDGRDFTPLRARFGEAVRRVRGWRDG